MIRLFGLLLSIAGVVFLAEHFLLTKQSFATDADLSTIHEDINNLITVVAECFVILFGLVLFAGNFKEKKVIESVIKRTHTMTEIVVSNLVKETTAGSFELDDSALMELALSYQSECPHRNVNDIINLKSLEISSIIELLPSEVRDKFEPLLKAQLRKIDETALDE
ncbi:MULTISPECIES: hypothetical protein [Pantoea]|uniref:Uncharacterized protein n=1 Tax=Candidatus Pantoea floridensis TaxID=1938870 RepID=A0A286BZS5_9GAMM|nr:MULTISPECIES: hypothetical protein [Pantoea]PIF22161.1 hypothetical protein BX596_1570 [Enterobacteriaceae bacterium JKS000233]PXW18554.1 hypothetical protein BY447_0107 [Pantoea sp. JKS000250]SOD39669.1 hypothetical protein SAMN06273570_4122 [Pantoea floridensis]